MRFLLLTFLLISVTLPACKGPHQAQAKTMTPQVQQGRRVFETYCARCHSTKADTIVVGPSLAGIASRSAGRVAGMDAQSYISDSIQNPTSYTVEGFNEGLMPSNLMDELSEEELEAVVAYLLTLQ